MPRTLALFFDLSVWDRKEIRMREFAVTLERRRGLDLFILRADNVREVRQYILKMFPDDDFVRILTVRRYTERAVESQFDPFGILAREREDQRARRRIDPADFSHAAKTNGVSALTHSTAKSYRCNREY